jgi:hypothetical protein
MTIMHFQEKNKNKLGRGDKADVTGKLRREVRHLARENRLKVNDMQCLLL